VTPTFVTTGLHGDAWEGLETVNVSYRRFLPFHLLSIILVRALIFVLYRNHGGYTKSGPKLRKGIETMVNYCIRKDSL
jgi:hypothetical protein